MSRKIPNCAECGATMKRKARILLEFPDLPGQPIIGWHPECARKDPMCQDAIDYFIDWEPQDEKRKELPEFFSVIMRRGPYGVSVKRGKETEFKRAIK